MSGAAGFLEFFILEASEYVEQLDGLLLRGGSGGPDGDAMQRAARALRGTATMAKIPAFAELAAGVERVGRALQGGLLRWDPSLGGAMVGAIDDLKALLHAARVWSPSDDQRARTRAAELARFAPVQTTSGGRTPVSGIATAPFFATEAANIAAGLELLTAHGGEVDTAANVLRRIRALRGVAGIKEIGPLADVLEATEDVARHLEGSQESLTPNGRRLMETAAAYLRTLSTVLRNGADVNAPHASRDEFNAARDAWDSRDGERERVVPIAHLFFDGERSGVVETSQHPPTTATERFRLEVVSLGEHLRQILLAARATGSGDPGPRAQRDIRRALRALESAAESFGEHDVAEFIRSHGPVTASIDVLGLSALDDLVSVLTEPGPQGQRMRGRLRELAGSRDVSNAIGAGFGRVTPAGASAMPRSSAGRSTPAKPEPGSSAIVDQTAKLDAAAAALIDSSINALQTFTSRPMTPPTPMVEAGELVPIESLLDRGRAALERAMELRDVLTGGGPNVDPDALEELFDLLDLARAG